MAATKSLRVVSVLPLEVEVIRMADGYRLDDADGEFRLSPGDARIEMPANAYSPTLYELNDSRTVWADGIYVATCFELGGGVIPLYAEEFLVDSDTMVSEVVSTSVEAILSRIDEIPAETVTELENSAKVIVQHKAIPPRT